MTAPISGFPALGSKAPAFYAITTNGTINFPEDFKGKWVILFSHPADFTPACTTEIATFAAMQEDFKALNTELIGLSVDSNSSHLAWLKEIEEKISFHNYNGQKINFPLIADNKGDIAALYGMFRPELGDTKTCRSVFFIDPDSTIRAMIHYPATTGRNFAEIKRVIEALQTTDAYGVSTPADWQPGDDVLLSAPQTHQQVHEREQKMPDMQCSDWFFCTQKYENLKDKTNRKATFSR